jgi:MFS superfamily sulfate permease-like transporter
MKQNQIIDERVVNQQRKITVESYRLVMIFLLFSMLAKQFILHLEPIEYLVEAIAFFGSAFYSLIRNIIVGNNLLTGSNSMSKNSKRLTFLNSIITGISVTVTLVFLRKEQFYTTRNFILESIMSFTCATLSSLVFFYIINKITNKRIKQIESKYNDDDDLTSL